MIRDRGNIKWTAMMLPEHIGALRDWIDENHYTERPELADWDLQSIQEEIEIAYKRKCEVLIKTWKDGKVTDHSGAIEAIDLRSKYIALANPFATDRISVSEIIGVQCVD